jgi:hypothetical protein
MAIVLDHLVVAARTLEEGSAWVQARLGVATSPGGRHEAMGTHNRVLGLGGGRYLEVIAVDPEAPPPSRPRWFDLDSPAMQERLANAPSLIHWVARTDDIARSLGAMRGGSEILALSRGEFHWKIAVPASGALSQGGISPTLTDSGCRLELLVLRHSDAPATLEALRAAGLSVAEPVQARSVGSGLEARIRTPRGVVELAE